MKKVSTRLLFILFVATAVKLNVADGDSKESPDEESAEVQSEDVTVDEAKVEYAKGSVCGYCTYCKFCKLCDKDCPCEQSKSKPNCHMCKYCKYCNLCSAFCDTVCTPGGILDKVSGAVVNSLPTFDKKEVDGDISSVKQWIDKKRDEL